MPLIAYTSGQNLVIWLKVGIFQSLALVTMAMVTHSNKFYFLNFTPNCTCIRVRNTLKIGNYAWPDPYINLSFLQRIDFKIVYSTYEGKKF